MSTKKSALLYQSGTIEQIYRLSDRLAEQNIRRFYFADHLIGGGNASRTESKPWLAMVPTMLGVALRHPDATIGPLVASPLLRPSAQLANEMSTIAHIVGIDRFILTVGAGGAISDQELLKMNLDVNELSSNFAQYLTDLAKLLNPSTSPLRLPQDDLKIRVASDSLGTIDLVNQFGSSWVTTGGWRTPFSKRVEKINMLYQRLRRPNFDGNTAICVANEDSIEITSSDTELEDYLSNFEFEVDELIFSISPSTI